MLVPPARSRRQRRLHSARVRRVRVDGERRARLLALLAARHLQHAQAGSTSRQQTAAAASTTATSRCSSAASCRYLLHRIQQQQQQQQVFQQESLVAVAHIWQRLVPLVQMEWRLFFQRVARRRLQERRLEQQESPEQATPHKQSRSVVVVDGSAQLHWRGRCDRSVK